MTFTEPPTLWGATQEERLGLTFKALCQLLLGQLRARVDGLSTGAVRGQLAAFHPAALSDDDLLNEEVSALQLATLAVGDVPSNRLPEGLCDLVGLSRVGQHGVPLFL